jgi:glycine cleavage system H protein
MVSEVPLDIYYTKEHEWIRVSDDGDIIIGITDHAQDALTDIVYIELPEAGGHCSGMEEFAIVESVKSASPIFAPLAGTITAVNKTLEDAPEQINQEPYGSGWIIKMKLDDEGAVDGLMSASDYLAMISE